MPTNSYKHASRFRKFPALAWGAVVLSVAVCAAMAWLHYRQDAVKHNARGLTEHIDEARVGLARGFAQFTMPGQPQGSLSRAAGFKQITQAIDELHRAESHLPGSEQLLAARAPDGPAFAGQIAEFRGLLDAWNQADEAGRQQASGPLQESFRRMEEFAINFDLAGDQALDALDAQLDRQFAWTLTCAVVLLGGVCAAVAQAGRRQAAALHALHESKGKLRVVGDNLPDSYVYQYTKDEAGRPRFVYVSAGVERVHGVKPEAVLRDAAAVLSQINPAQTADLIAAEEASLRDLSDFEMELSIRRADGALRQIYVGSRPRRLADGQVHWDGIATDITERKQAEEALRESEARFSKVFHSSSIGINIIRLSDLRSVDANQAYLKLVGREWEQVVGRSAAELKVFVELEQFQAALQEFLRTGRLGNRDLQLRSRSGEIRDALVSIEKIELKGEAMALMLVADITGRKQAESALRFHQVILQEMGRIAKVGGWSFEVATGEGTWTDEVARIHDLEPGSPTSRDIGLSYYAPSSRPAIEAAVKAAVEHALPYDLELELITAKGVCKWVRTIGHPVLQDGKVVRMHGSFQDVSERHQMAAARERQQRRVALLGDVSRRLVLSDSPEPLLDGIFADIAQELGGDIFANYMVAPAGNRLFLKSCGGLTAEQRQAFAELPFGVSLCGLVAQERKPLIFSDLPQVTLSQAQGIIALGVQAYAGHPLLAGDRLLGTISFGSRSKDHFAEEDVRLMKGVVDQVSAALERNRLVAALRESEAQKASIFNSVASQIAVLDQKGLIVAVNSAWTRFTVENPGPGGNPSTACGVGANYFDVCRSGGRPGLVGVASVVEGLKSVLEGRLPDFTLEYPCHSPAEQRWFSMTVTPLGTDGEGLVVAHTNISERRRAEESLRFRNVILSTQQEASIDGILVVDDALRIVSCNRRFQEIWGIPPSLIEAGSDVPVLEFVTGKVENPGQFLTRISELNGHREEIGRDEIQLSDGRTIDRYSAPMVAENGQYFGRVWYFRDVTERKQLEAQLRQAQKMEAIGQLAGGVAHDFNNILAAIMMQTELVTMDETLPAEAVEGLQEIRASAERAANLTRQLLLFSRRQMMQARDLDLNEIVTNLAKMLRRIIGEHFRLQLHLHPEPLMTFADGGMLDQVLMNLAVNARDAMPDGGSLTIETSEMLLDEAAAKRMPEVAPGPYVCLLVADTGCGIPPEILPRIFEPFFTTKEQGKGTGLGLATVFGIVKQHRGWIDVESRPGFGTTFKAYFPASLALAPAAAELVAKTRPKGGTETILLAEDDAALRKLTRVTLERSGYRVLEAPDGVEALKLWQENRGAVALLLTDLVMPAGVSGQRLAQKIQEDQPELNIIFTSGYSRELAGKGLQLGPYETFLPKPCPPATLLAAVRQALDG